MCEPLKFLPQTREEKERFEEEWLIAQVQSAIEQTMAVKGISRAELARRIGRSKASVTQLLRDGRNPTLRTIAQCFLALDARVSVSVRGSARSQRIEWRTDAVTDSREASDWYRKAFDFSQQRIRLSREIQGGAWISPISDLTQRKVRAINLTDAEEIEGVEAGEFAA